MKKVLFTATVDSHILHFHLPFLKLFKEKGYEVHVATNGNEEIPYCDVKHMVSFERSPIKINNIRAIRQLKKIIAEEKFDIIHTHTPMGSVVTRLAARKARKKFHTRVIYTAHGFHFYKGAPKFYWGLFYPVEKCLSKYTDTLITINKEDYELAKRKFKKCLDIQYIPGVGIDEEKFNFSMTQMEKLNFRRELGLKETDFVLIYPAELSNCKRQIWLIHSLASLLKENSSIKLLLPGRDNLQGECEKLVKYLGLEDKIYLLGYRKDIPKLLKISNVSISASKREGLPVNIMEAMYTGLPIVASNCRGNRDLVQNNKNGFIYDLEDSQRLQEKIEYLFHNKNVHVSMAKEDSKLIAPYLLPNILEKMTKIYFKPKKIAYLRSTSIINDSRATKEITSLLKGNFEVEVFGWDRDGSANQLDDIKTLYGSAKFHKLNLNAPYGSGMKNLRNILKFQKWLHCYLKKGKFDLVHSCDLDTGMVAYSYCKRNNVKLVYDIYDYYVDCHHLPSIMARILEKKEMNIIDHADVTILCNEWRKKQIVKASPKKTLIIHNSPNFDPSEFEKKDSIVKSTNNKIKVVYVGILQDDRLLKEVCEEIKKQPDIELHIGGFGKYEAYFKQASKENNNIFFYGTMSYPNVIKLESECDLLFATYNPDIKNHRYSAPNKVYEAMYLKKPIIVCNQTGVDEFVRSHHLGFEIPYNANDFIRAIKKYQTNKKMWDQKDNDYENTYSWNVMEKKLIAEYNRLLKVGK